MRLRIPRERIPDLAAFALLLFAMLFRLTFSPLWGDEWNEFRFSQRPFEDGEFYKAVVGTFQPPLYNVLMHFWLAAGKSMLWFRLFNVPVALASALLLHASMRETFGRRTAWVSVCALAVCHQWVFCVQECSEYALMLLFLFLALRFYAKVVEGFSPGRFAWFLAGCVGAVWSQYGAVFVAVPLLVSVFLRTVLPRAVPLRRKLAVAGAYALCAAAFGIPLLVWFLLPQMEHGRIAGGTVPFSPALLRDLPLVPGRILAFLYALGRYAAWRPVEPVFCVAFLLLWGFVALRPLPPARRGIVHCSAACLLLHFVLVRLHVYAMLPSGASGGFLCRYSLFWIPLFAFLVPALVHEAVAAAAPRGTAWRRAGAVLAALAVLCAAASFREVLRNGRKAYDDLFADAWYRNEAWRHRTYVFGFSRAGFAYWIPRHPDYRDGMLENVRWRSEKGLPDTFCVWSANWRPKAARDTLKRARKHGLEIRYEFDDGTNILAFCRPRAASGAPREDGPAGE